MENAECGDGDDDECTVEVEGCCTCMNVCMYICIHSIYMCILFTCLFVQ